MYGGLVTAAGAGLALTRAPAPSRPARERPHAPLLFVGVNLLLLLNQLAVAVYTAAFQGGSPHFVKQWLSALPWFDIPAHWPIVQRLAGLAAATPGAEQVLAYSVLQVQAVLELPFSLLAYLTAAWFVDRGVYRHLLRWPLWLMACVGYTATFMVVEWELFNPWTVADLKLRVVGAALCVPLGGWLARRAGPAGGFQPRTRSAGGALAALLAIALLSGLVVLMLYLTLCYNLAALSGLWPLLLSATLGLLLLARLLGREGTLGPWRDRAGPPVTFLSRAGGWFVLLGFPVALMIRYRWGAPGATATALFVAAAALGLAASHTARVYRGERLKVLVPGLVGMALAGWVAGTDLFGLLHGPWLGSSDLRIAQRVLLFVPSWLVCWTTLQALLPVGRDLDEAEFEVDQVLSAQLHQAALTGDRH